jgi:hypothetical protein
MPAEVPVQIRRWPARGVRTRHTGLRSAPVRRVIA